MDKTRQQDAKTLSPQQIQAIGLLLTGSTKLAAAKEVGVSRQTMSAWAADPLFKQALADGQAQLMAELNRRLLAAAGAAVDYLLKVLKRPRNQAVGVRAADVILRRLLQTRDLTELEQRILALEGRDNDNT